MVRKFTPGDLIKLRYWKELWTIHYFHSDNMVWVYRYNEEGDYIHGTSHIDDLREPSKIENMIFNLKKHGQD